MFSNKPQRHSLNIWNNTDFKLHSGGLYLQLLKALGHILNVNSAESKWISYIPDFNLQNVKK